MANLSAPVVNGALQQDNTAITTTSPKVVGSSKLGKDAFLQLLVAQMQYQDPLNPSTDTQFVAQLASFSQLEELQNLKSTSEQSQAFSLIGREVILSTKDSNGKQTEISGEVDFITVKGSKIKLSVGGKLYDLSDLSSVVDSSYSEEVNSPKVTKAVEYTYDGNKPENLTFEVDFGYEKMKSDDVAVMLGEQVLDKSMISVSGNKVTIKAEAFAKLPDGKYAPSVVFNNDPYFTAVENQLKITVVNSKAAASEEEDTLPPDNGEAAG